MGAAFFLGITVAALAILGAIGDGLAILLGVIHPWDFS